MTPLDELIRDAMADIAEDHSPAVDLGERTVRAGRGLRRRRRLTVASAALITCAVLVGTSVGIDHAIEANRGAQQLTPAGGPHPKRGVTPSLGPVAAWSSWPTDRLYGAKPPTEMFKGLPADARVLASGTMPDGMDFRIASIPDDQQPIDDLYGYQDQPIFGDEPAPGSPEYRPHAPYFALETMTAATWNHGQENQHDGFWLIVVGQPDTTSASYSTDGVSWTPMHIENGIAVLKLNATTASLPPSAELTLANANGTYVTGPLDTL
jgi:hypothetical protein